MGRWLACHAGGIFRTFANNQEVRVRHFRRVLMEYLAG
jgi:hypothetical protein